MRSAVWNEGDSFFHWPDFQLAGDLAWVCAAFFMARALIAFSIHHAKPGHGAKLGDESICTSCPPALHGLVMWPRDFIGHVPHFLVALKCHDMAISARHLPLGDCRASFASYVDAAQVVAEQLFEHLGGLGSDGDLMVVCRD